MRNTINMHKIKRLVKRFIEILFVMMAIVISYVLRLFKLKSCYICPICGYHGLFLSERPETGKRKHAKCPKCGLLERHRLQYLVFKKVTEGINTQQMSMLHFAPEKYFSSIFKNQFKFYVTADLNSTYVDKKEDLTRLSFKDNSFDFIFASHVLEHIKEDGMALSEIKRVLKPNGIAIIPVPVIGKRTVEYPKPNPHEEFHVRCPGEDYYERYSNYFSKVDCYKSTDFDEKYQLHVYEDRSGWPTSMPLRPSVCGKKHIDRVPVCVK